MKDFIVQYYKEVIFIFSLLLELILLFISIIKKKKIFPIGDVIGALPDIISDVEKNIGSGNGAFKKQLVLNSALKLYKKISGVDVSLNSSISKDIAEQIEKILKTPQRKEKS